ncbi:MAG: extracellular solute-binding protein [Lachnospiraceae bacterium]|nr:extracellular solute-binding protein [Lachnospiraceae bacterium]
MKKQVTRSMRIVMSGALVAALAAGSLGMQAGAEEEVTLTWLSHYQEEGKLAWVENCVALFEEAYPNVTVNVEVVDADSYDTILQTKLASDDAPSIFDLSSNYDVGVYQEAGHLADLSDLECLDNVDPDLLLEGQIDGVQYGVPIEMSGYGVFYNEEVFEEYGLSVPTTVSELTEICEVLMENGVQPFAAPFAEQWAFAYYLRCIVDITCVKEDNDWFADKMSLESSFSDDEVFKESVETFFSFHEYWGDDPFGTSWDDAQQMVANGEAAMCVHGSWAVDGFLSYNADCQIGVFAMPVSEDSSDCAMIKEPGQQLVLYNNSDEAEMEAAYNFYNMIYSEEFMTEYAEGAHQMPSVTGEYDMLEALQTIVDYPEDQSFVESGLTTFTSEYEDAYYELLTNYSMGDTFDVDGFCEDLDAAFAAIG